MITPQEALGSKEHRTFYRKIWQQNSFYPIDKFVWNESEQAWEHFIFRKGWESLGCPYPSLTVIGNIILTNYLWLIRLFQQDPCILSYNEMIDNNNYNET